MCKDILSIWQFLGYSAREWETIWYLQGMLANLVTIGPLQCSTRASQDRQAGQAVQQVLSGFHLCTVDYGDHGHFWATARGGITENYGEMISMAALSVQSHRIDDHATSSFDSTDVSDMCRFDHPRVGNTKSTCDHNDISIIDSLSIITNA